MPTTVRHPPPSPEPGQDAFHSGEPIAAHRTRQKRGVKWSATCSSPPRPSSSAGGARPAGGTETPAQGIRPPQQTPPPNAKGPSMQMTYGLSPCLRDCHQYLLKRGVHGTFHHVSRRHLHLHRYCDEFSFRWNGRKVTDGARSGLAIRGAEGKRLAYQQTTAEAIS